MRLAFMGKGGSGKTTLTGAFVKYLARTEEHVLAIDGDVNVHLGNCLGIEISSISDKESEIFEYFEGYRNMPLIGTTPPTNESKFIIPNKNDDFIKKFATQNKNISLLTVGTYQTEDVGFSCYHSKLGGVEMIFHHLLDKKNDFVVSDFTAGIDSLGTSMFMVSDLNVFVVEPTNKSLSVYLDFKKKSELQGVKVMAIANKILNKEDEEFIKQNIEKDELIGIVEYSHALHKFERGDESAFEEFVNANEKLFELIKTELLKTEKNWGKYYDTLLSIYVANCKQWYNFYYAIQLDNKVDKDFSYEKILKKYDS